MSLGSRLAHESFVFHQQNGFWPAPLACVRERGQIRSFAVSGWSVDACGKSQLLTPDSGRYPADQSPFMCFCFEGCK